jgi:CheY-like chemotaxis protein
MDIQMPELDGASATKRILQQRPDCQILAMTANLTTSDIQEYKTIGFIDVVPKPFRLFELVDILDRHLS